jgi:hypothetical protein
MKRTISSRFYSIILSVLLLGSGLNLMAQAPNLFNYQGVARNAVGNPLPNQTMHLRISIRDVTAVGPVVYSETRSVQTNSWGLFAVQVGSAGTMSTTGTIAGVNWLQGNKFLEVEIDPNAGFNYINLGVTQLLSVPYAFNAVTAGSAAPSGAAGGDLSGLYPNPAVASGAITTIKLADRSVNSIKLSDQAVTTIKIADNAITTDKLSDGSVTNAKIAAGISASKVGLGNVDNTSDLNKPISLAVQAALDKKVSGADIAQKANTADMNAALALKANSTDVTTALALKVDKVSGKDLSSNDYTNAEKSKLAAITGINTGDQDLSAYATTANLALKANTTEVTTALALKANSADVTTALDLKAPLASPALTGTPLAPTATAGTNTTQIATTAFVSDAVATAATPEATTLVKGRVQLAGDLSGTAALPVVGAGKITTTKLANGAVTGEKVADLAIINAKIAADAAIADTKLGTISTAGKVSNSATSAASANTANAIVTRDENGNFSAGTITASLTGNASSATKASHIAGGSAGMIPYQTAENTTAFLAAGTAGQFLQSNGTDAPVWGTITIGGSLDQFTDAKMQGAEFTGSLIIGHKTTGTLSNAQNNTAVGVGSVAAITSGNANTVVGAQALAGNTSGSNNTVLGASAGRYIADGTTLATIANQSVFIGAATKPKADNESNQIVIGYNAIGNGANTIQLGNTSITNVATSGTITAGAVTYPKTDGTTGQALLTNGSGVLYWGNAGGSIQEVADEFTASAAQTSFTLTQTPAASSKVKMFVNGIRISNTAYTVSGSTLTYVPANNGGYTLTVGDRIQFDFYY